MKPFREYKVWQLAHELTLSVYEVSAGFPRSEVYGLSQQMRRSSASVPTNIAEGSARSDAEFQHFLRIALGSATELEYQFILSKDLGYITEETYSGLDARVGSVKRMLVTFIQRAAGAGVAGASPRTRPTANGQRPTAPKATT